MSMFKATSGEICDHCTSPAIFEMTGGKGKCKWKFCKSVAEALVKELEEAIKANS